jgi:hypothetical protein
MISQTSLKHSYVNDTLLLPNYISIHLTWSHFVPPKQQNKPALHSPKTQKRHSFEKESPLKCKKLYESTSTHISGLRIVFETVQ